METSSKIIFSIIIPFYNVEKYIAQCLDSVFNQDIPENEYEVICVNDASPDNSRDIVIEFQKKHANLILIEHEVNKKLGAARNTGRSIARGKYIWNVDSDDYIKPNILGKINVLFTKNDLDILMFNHDVFFDGVNQVEYENKFKNSEICNGIFFVNEYFNSQIGQIGQIWSQIYSLDYLNQKAIYSPEINMAEDGPFTWRSLIFATRVMSVSEYFYIYRMNNNSLTSIMVKKPTPQMVFEKIILFNIEVIGLIEDLYIITDKSIENNLKQIIRYAVNSGLDNYLKLKFIEKLKFINLLYSNKQKIIKLMPYLDTRKRLFLKAILLKL